MTLKILKEILIKMYEHALREKPIECCGYLAGIENKITNIYLMKNMDNSPNHFSFDPKEQFKIVKTMREEGIKPIVVYHSHPETPARMSDEDIRLANDPDIYYGIISLIKQPYEFKIFSVKDKIIKNIDYEII